MKKQIFLISVLAAAQIFTFPQPSFAFPQAAPENAPQRAQKNDSRKNSRKNAAQQNSREPSRHNAPENAAESSAKNVSLKFNPQNFSESSLQMPDGKIVRFRAYEGIFYVENVEDATHQILNFYVPESLCAPGANDDVPILFKTNVGGYMASRPRRPSASDATGRALAEGFAVCIAGSRGSDSYVEKNGEKIYNGRAPAGLLDLKAAVRYLRKNDKIMPGNAEKIVTDGMSAGGSLSALLGATGNSPLFSAELKKMGAADTRDDVFAAVSFCPSLDLDHADFAYEWLFQCVNDSRGLSDAQKKISQRLAAAFPAYLEKLHLRASDGTPLTEKNYRDYVKSFLIKSVQRAIDEGCEIPDGIGVRRTSATENSRGGNGNAPRASGDGNNGGNGNFQQNRQRGNGGPPQHGNGNFQNGNRPHGNQAQHGNAQQNSQPNAQPNGTAQQNAALNVNAQPTQQPAQPQRGNANFQQRGNRPQRSANGNGGPPQRANGGNGNGPSRGGNGGNSAQQGEFVADIDLETFLRNAVGKFKTPPAFDSLNILGGTASAANQAFGDTQGNSANFTNYGIRLATNDARKKVDDAIRKRVFMMNAMNFIEDEHSTKARHWYLRAGTRDANTSFCVPVNFATKLMNNGFDVDFRLPWNRPHSGDYALDELFAWIHRVCDEPKN